VEYIRINLLSRKFWSTKGEYTSDYYLIAHAMFAEKMSECNNINNNSLINSLTYCTLRCYDAIFSFSSLPPFSLFLSYSRSVECLLACMPLCSVFISLGWCNWFSWSFIICCG